MSTIPRIKWSYVRKFFSIEVDKLNAKSVKIEMTKDKVFIKIVCL